VRWPHVWVCKDTSSRQMYLCRGTYTYTIFFNTHIFAYNYLLYFVLSFQNQSFSVKKQSMKAVLLNTLPSYFSGTSHAEGISYVMSTCLSACIKVTPRFTQNFIFVTSTKICQNNLLSLKTGHK